MFLMKKCLIINFNRCKSIHKMFKIDYLQKYIYIYVCILELKNTYSGNICKFPYRCRHEKLLRATKYIHFLGYFNPNCIWGGGILGNEKNCEKCMIK